MPFAVAHLHVSAVTFSGTGMQAVGGVVQSSAIEERGEKQGARGNASSFGGMHTARPVRLSLPAITFRFPRLTQSKVRSIVVFLDGLLTPVQFRAGRGGVGFWL
ncbi:MAG: hypothetical protein J2P36_04355 [Ktedonobacteraceae bacterium]|nr:hypothetical protein [Ktedonobacteraceae bacterium]